MKWVALKVDDHEIPVNLDGARCVAVVQPEAGVESWSVRLIYPDWHQALKGDFATPEEAKGLRDDIAAQIGYALAGDGMAFYYAGRNYGGPQSSR